MNGSDERPTTRSPTPSANRVSVAAGVSETIFFGSAGIVTEVPSSSVRVSGNRPTDGAAVAVGDAVAGAVAGALTVALAGLVARLLSGAVAAGAPAEHAASRTARIAAVNGRMGRTGRRRPALRASTGSSR